MNTKLIIPVGGMYQEWMNLIDLVEEDTVKKLNEVVVTEGFEELVNWSKPETDLFVLVGDNYLVCQNKSNFSIS